MNYTITKDRSQLVLTVDEDERALLCELGEAIHRDMTMYEFFEHLVCNSELEWITPERTGDLTDAPMLGLYERGGPAMRSRSSSAGRGCPTPCAACSKNCETRVWRCWSAAR